MVGINCLFNYDGVNYRLNIIPKNGKEGITFDEFRLNLLDHPKLKEIDFFDTEKYVVEVSACFIYSYIHFSMINYLVLFINLMLYLKLYGLFLFICDCVFIDKFFFLYLDF